MERTPKILETAHKTIVEYLEQEIKPELQEIKEEMKDIEPQKRLAKRIKELVGNNRKLLEFLIGPKKEGYKKYRPFVLLLIAIVAFEQENNNKKPNFRANHVLSLFSTMFSEGIGKKVNEIYKYYLFENSKLMSSYIFELKKEELTGYTKVKNNLPKKFCEELIKLFRAFISDERVRTLSILRAHVILVSNFLIES